MRTWAPVSCVYVVHFGLSDPGQAPSFEDWYDKIHLPRILAVPGFLSAHRFTSTNGERYFTVYGIEGPHVLESNEYRALPGWEHWRPLVIDWHRAIYSLVESLGSRDR